MREAILITGDVDFRPALQSLEQLGTRTRLIYDPRSCSEELVEVADFRQAITHYWLYLFAEQSFQVSNPVPVGSVGQAITRAEGVVANGQLGGRDVKIMKDSFGIYRLAVQEPSGNWTIYPHRQLEFLRDRWAPSVLGDITWS